jgi:hypothetical protein
MNKLLLYFFILTYFVFADDSTITTVGPGFKLYSVVKTSGPFNIRILEIDISQTGNKIEGVLAKDVLGTGFEKTSSMASRKNKTGHIVIGAINGDFFGISEPNNPYTFLTGSMVQNKEYSFGRTNSRPLFGMRVNKKPLIENMGLTATLYAKNNTNRNVNSINGSRDTNTLVLYNRYFGISTKTNAIGTEVKLKPITNFQTNVNQKYIVLQKVEASGNMTIAPGDYILSGNGTGAVFLNSNININDTVEIKIGTNPNRGSILELIGGYPILVINGQKPTSFPNADVHPRTAIGFNQDSTKVFFVTVDGRQPTLSVGMSYDQLATYLLSIGCYQAVNLDGGGSTTMVVRGAIVNSPSDAGGERSVGNALLAVLEAPTLQIIDSLKLYPRSIYIDSTQSKKIDIKGKDKWGYIIEVSPNEVSWQVIGISGTVDTLGFFKPSSTGSGKIIGRIGTLTDTILVTVIKTKIPTWSFSSAGGNLPSWFSTTGSTERGIAFGKVQGLDRVYICSRPNIFVLDASTGDKLGQLNISGVSGGTFTLNDVDVSSDGVIFGCNLTTSSSSDPFKVYKWTSDTSNPTAVITYLGGNYRLGDKFTVVGSFSNNTAIIYCAAASSNKIFKWKMSSGQFNQTPEEITLSDITSGGYSPSVGPKGLDSTRFFFNGHGIYPKEYLPNGTIVGTMSSSLVPSGSNAIRYFEKAGKKFIVTYVTGFGNENAKIVEVTNGIANAVLLETTPTLGSNTNTVGLSGDVAVRDYNNRIIIVYVLATNNGYGAYSLTFDTLTSTQNNIKGQGVFELFQNYPNPFNPTTKIKYSLASRQTVILKLFDILGNEIVTLVNDKKDAGNYEVEFNANNSEFCSLPSGVYFYQLRAGKFLENRKMLLIK